MAVAGRERRKHPRVSGREGLRLHAGEAECRIIDISCSGVRFVTSHPLHLMAMLDIRLEVPAPAPSGFACQGAVVRTRPCEDGTEDQEVAVFFTRLDDDARLAIGDYVRRQSSATA